MIEIKGKFCKDLKIFTDNIEEDALKQLYKIADERAMDGKKIRVMPDVHMGKGITIGFSCPIDVEKDYVNPEHLGCDIGCEVSSIFYDKPIKEDSIELLEHRLKTNVPMGFKLHEKTMFDAKTLIKMVNKEFSRLVSRYPSFSDYIPSITCEVDLEKYVKKFGMDYGTFLKSIGTVGGGKRISCFRAI